MLNIDGRTLISKRYNNKRNHNFINRLYETHDTKFGLCDIIRYNDASDITVRFRNTGYELDTSGDLVRGEIKDLLSPSVCGIGYLGLKFKDINTKKDKVAKKIHAIWCAMLSRCYEKNNKKYKIYGGIGVKVCDEWLNFSNFYDDFKQLDGYDEDIFINAEGKDKLTLDKDKYQINISKSKRIYSRKTCCLITKKEQRIYEDYNTPKYIVATHPTGEATKALGIRELARKLNLDSSSISKCLRGKRSSVKGYTFKMCDDDIV